MKYSSDRNFRIWFYTVAHDHLLLRSPLIFADAGDSYSADNNFTIDIEFAGVSRIEMPTMLHGLAISSSVRNPSKVFKNYRNLPGRLVFEIRSWQEVFYVEACSCIIGKSNWLVENRIKNPNLNYDEIIARTTWKDDDN